VGVRLRREDLAVRSGPAAGAGLFAEAFALLGRAAARRGVAAAGRRRLGPKGQVCVGVLLGRHDADRERDTARARL
jgi:hypothetical protein